MINPLKISEMLSKAGEMQEEVQRKLGETVVEASSGGGAVTATMNGKKELLKIHIDPSAVMSLSGSQPDVEMLEDLIVAAVNEAGRKADEAIKSSVQGMLGGLKIPGLTARSFARARATRARIPGREVLQGRDSAASRNGCYPPSVGKADQKFIRVPGRLKEIFCKSMTLEVPVAMMQGGGNIVTLCRADGPAH